MKFLSILLIALLVLFALFILAVRGRKGNKGLDALRGWNYAHRGLHDNTRPENSMAAFRAALNAGYGSELDVHLLRDGTLAVLHDSDLMRMTGREGTVEALRREDLDDHYLAGTLETIPTFQQVLDLYAGKAPLIVELKSAGNNYARLAEAACALLDTYPGVYCIESFDPRCVYWLKKHRPDVIRGQLSENFLAGKTKAPWILKFFMTHQLFNFLTLPDFVAYNFVHRKRLSNVLARKLWGVQGVTWTLQSPREHKTALVEGWIPIFENYMP